MKRHAFAIAAAAAMLLAACSGLKDAFSAHTDRVATAADAELTVPRLGQLLGKSRAPVRKDIAKSIASVWVDYQLLGVAAANNDSLNDPEAVEEAMWPAIANLKARKWYEQVSKGWGTEDPAAAASKYASGEILAADHILLLTQGMTPPQKAEVKRKIDAVRAGVSQANFAATATANSQDQGSARRGGSLGIFPKGQMVPEFERGLTALRPGQISPVIETQYGYHIIHRPTFEQVKPQLLQASKGRTMVVAESTYLAKLEASGKIDVKKEAVPTIRALAADPDAHRRDRTVLATSTAGQLTTMRLIGWLETLQPNANILDQLKQAPDSVIVSLVRNFAKNELILKQADSARVQIDTTELANLRRSFTGAVTAAWQQLGVAPASLETSAKSENEREILARGRIDEYFDKMVSEQAPFVPVPTPIANVLREKYKYSFNQTGFDRAVEEASKVRNAADSAMRAAQPSTIVPMAPPASSTPPRTP
ncbi:MAG TPA: peptidylprolyl isomerase [Gemmatimonadaceae bacterium]|nr:peptidylprolyl isomerase [Gemmatimonadaceae bacterium]